MSSRTFTVIALVTLGPAWLRMSRAEREAFNDQHVAPVLARYAGRVGMRHVDVEAFTGRCSDVLVFTTGDLAEFASLWDDLRDTPLFALPLLTVDDVLVGLDAAWVREPGQPTPAAATT
ncbi:darcynin family protein [Blastococcus sp. SYSU D00669]